MAAHGVEEHSTCPICGSSTLIPRFRVAFPTFGPNYSRAWKLEATPPVPYWNVVACSRCGVHFPDPFPNAGDIDRFYGDQQSPNDWEMEHYVQRTPDRAAHWLGFAAKLTRLTGGTGRLLEVGPAAGHLLEAAEKLGWSVMGVEATPKFSAILRDRGLPVHQGQLATLPPADPYDVVVMVDVLEHLRDPISDLALCHSLMKSDGWLVVATCDIGSFAARHYGLRWRQIVISHTFYWTRRSLSIALQRAGFEVVQFSSFRWWDPHRRRETLAWFTEFGKLLARHVLLRSAMPLFRNWGPSQRLLSAMTRGRIDLRQLEHKVGDQAVMSDVILIVARPRIAQRIST